LDAQLLIFAILHSAKDNMCENLIHSNTQLCLMHNNKLDLSQEKVWYQYACVASIIGWGNGLIRKC